MNKPSGNLTELRDAVTVIDCLSQEGTSKIQVLAGLALDLMETPQAYQRPETIAKLLITMKDVADGMANAIGGTAEDVGCRYVDDAEERRFQARLNALNEHSPAPGG